MPIVRHEDSGNLALNRVAGVGSLGLRLQVSRFGSSGFRSRAEVAGLEYRVCRALVSSLNLKLQI